MRKNCYTFDTPYGPAHVLYSVPEKNEYLIENGHPEFTQCVVQCTDHIVWDDSTGNWWPEPQVVDYVLPRARAVCEIVGVPAFHWLDQLRRGDIWAIENEFQQGRPISHMMEYSQ